MIKAFKYIFVLFFFQIYAQNDVLLKFEKSFSKEFGEGREFKKHLIDLNSDEKEDVIYFFNCGEPNCVKIFLSDKDKYKEVLFEQCSNYTLWRNNEKEVILKLELFQCCGESPYFSERKFNFKALELIVSENFVSINPEYVANAKNLKPENNLANPYFVKNTIEDYNIRFNPTLENQNDEVKESFQFGCEEGTNIISKIKLNSRIKVLAELIQNDRTWLFVEVESKFLNKKCNPVSFDFDNQSLRGWISNKFVEKL